jgi:hypothetical protein
MKITDIRLGDLVQRKGTKEVVNVIEVNKKANIVNTLSTECCNKKVWINADDLDPLDKLNEAIIGIANMSRL